MRVSNLKKGKERLSEQQFSRIMNELRIRFDKAGFITDVVRPERHTKVNRRIVSSKRIENTLKIGLHMRSFKIDTAKHDRNLRTTNYRTHLTDTPTWDQRVEFNNIVNEVLDKWEVSGNVTSGCFTIRKGFESYTESDWYDQQPMQYGNYNVTVETCDEKEYLEEKRIARNKAAKEKREISKKWIIENVNNVPADKRVAFADELKTLNPEKSVAVWADETVETNGKTYPPLRLVRL